MQNEKQQVGYGKHSPVQHAKWSCTKAHNCMSLTSVHPLLSSFLIYKLSLHFSPPSFIFCYSLLEKHFVQFTPKATSIYRARSTMCVWERESVWPTWEPKVIVSQIAIAIDLLTLYHCEPPLFHTHTHKEMCHTLHRRPPMRSKSSKCKKKSVCSCVFFVFSHQNEMRASALCTYQMFLFVKVTQNTQTHVNTYTQTRKDKLAATETRICTCAHAYTHTHTQTSNHLECPD